MTKDLTVLKPASFAFFKSVAETPKDCNESMDMTPDAVAPSSAPLVVTSSPAAFSSSTLLFCVYL
jgi:hypothetical protein